MFDAEQIGMQGLSAKGLEGRSGLGGEAGGLGLEASAIDVVAEERMADRGKMDADLMGAPGLQPAGQQAGDRRAIGAKVALQQLPMGHGLAAAIAYRHLVAGARVTVERLVDGAARPVGRAPDEPQETAGQGTGAAAIGGL